MAAERKASILSFQRTLQALKQRANKILTFVASFKDGDDPLQLEIRRTGLEDMRESFFETETKLYGLIKDDEVSAVELAAEEYYDLLGEITYQIAAKLKPLSNPSEAKPHLDTSVSQKPFPDSSIKLPDITLPRFSGHYEEWIYFRSQFNLLIRRNESLNDQQRLHYLRSCLTGKAAGIETPEESFSSLWKALETRYENRRWLVDRHLAEIFQLKSIPCESSTALRDLVNVVQKNLRALSSLKLNLDTLSESMVVYIVASKLDKQTHKDFQSQIVGTNLVKWQEMVEFLQNRCRILENLEQDNKLASRVVSKPVGTKQFPKVFVSTKEDDSKRRFACFHCSGGHYINECRSFLARSPSQRFQRVKELRLCVNCFSNRHVVADCKSSSCKDCGQRHNTLLHFEPKASSNLSGRPKINQNTRSDNGGNESAPEPGPSRVELCAVTEVVDVIESTNMVETIVPEPDACRTPSSLSSTRATKRVQLITATDQALLHTAIVNVRGENGELQECRAVLDSCAMSTFMTSACVQKLRLKAFPSDVSVVGFGGAGRKIAEAVVAHVSSKCSYFDSISEFLVTPNITTKLPLRPFKYSHWNIPEWIDLADPNFNQPARVEILFGILDWDKMMLSRSYKLSDGLPTLRQTVFGWVAGGPVMERSSYPIVQALPITNEQLDDQLSKFWELEAYGQERIYCSDEQKAEEHFSSTHYRDGSGRYVLALPFKDTDVKLGDSKRMAHRRFLLLEKRLEKDEHLYSEYRKFMQEYLDMEYMEKVGTFSPVEQSTEESYFIPHHAIQRPDSSTTKVRVVFDASAKSSNGVSLNDLLLVGPTLQPHLVNILLAFRVHKVVATTDVSKMFRQISIREEDRRFLHILWRSSPEEEISVYRLTTVTYGTACAPFQATRTLIQICDDESDKFPLAAQFGKKSVYVDDALFGAETVEEVQEMRKQFEAMLATAGLELHKWCSNREEVLADLPTEKLEQKVLFSKEGRTKTLGLTWQPTQDIFSFQIPSAAFSEGVPSKRKVLSDISKLFDPLGFAGPVVMTGKLLMQELWKQKQSWDGALDAKQEKLWYEYRRQLQEMETIKISRCVLPLSNTISVDLLGFSDASEKGYGACLYLRSRNIQGQISIRLLCSKSHVAPLKANRATIPRLELCGAVLLAQLVDQVTRSLPVDIDQIKLWSDSTIALSWINTCPSKLDVFVANRVTKILRVTKPANWYHVSGYENPADLASRGIMPNELESASLWWRGPLFLKDPETTWCKNVNLITEDELPELTTITTKPVVTERFQLFDNSSKYNTMVRVVARIKRLFQNRKRGPDHQFRGEYTMQELRLAKLTLVRLVQKEAYPEVFDHLQNQVTTRNNSLIPLSPFVDNHGILRVGGRLSKSSCSYDQKHQMILPSSHPFTEAVIRSVHTSNMHVGAQTTLNAIRREYWIVRGKSAVKRVIRGCVRCFKISAHPIHQYMGDLPACRLEAEYPFYRVGIDLCGPIVIKQRNKRSTVEHKGWIALFVCLETKAIHLEIVSELSTGAFMAAFDRFISRRGKPATVWTDNGTNFVGTSNILKQWKEFFESSETQEGIQQASDSEIEWCFNPPEAPHFGGIWEANIRQTKSLLIKYTAGATLCFEELSTVLARIEAVLNSRPITSLSDDPEDFEPLTPGHFLIFRPLTAIPQPEVSLGSKHPRSRFEHINHIVKHFWDRWSSEYLSSLQQRYKWHKKVEVKQGQLVLIKKDNLPIQKWLLGRIVELFPGTDGVTRVVNVKTKNGLLRRSVSKLCFLPVDPEQTVGRDVFQRGEDV